jgi:N-acetylglucosamine-6-phosphate deacetylase
MSAPTAPFPVHGDLTVRGGLLVDPGRAAESFADVVAADGLLVHIAPDTEGPPGLTLDAQGCKVVPGFVDIQVNGAFGIDLTNEPHRIPEVASQLVRFGVTAFCPTVITGPDTIVPEAIRALQEIRRAGCGLTRGSARILGLHVEGPFLAPGRPGAHPAEHIRSPSVSEVRSWLELVRTGPDAVNLLAILTIAPELPGALDVIDLLARAGVTTCAGHTDASAREIAAAEARGLTGVTHLFNAMSPLGHREPGAVGGTLTSEGLIAGVIADGVHVDPATICIAWRLLGAERIALVSDGIAALGLGDGSFELGEVTVDVSHGVARTTEGVLAGSVLSMDQAVRNLMAYTGCSLSQACRAAATTPARLVGAAGAGLGRLATGRPADLTLLNESHQVVATVVGGTVCHDPEGRVA